MKLHFLYNTIKKSLTANSLNSTELLAIIVGEILQKQIEMTPKNITIIAALHSMNNYDLDNFYKIYKSIFKTNSRTIRLDNLYCIVDKNKIRISINKLVNLQLII